MVKCIYIFDNILIILLYYNFNEFEKHWYLNKYKHLKNNIKKQELLHKQVTNIIQTLLGFQYFDLSNHSNKEQ